VNNDDDSIIESDYVITCLRQLWDVTGSF